MLHVKLSQSVSIYKLNTWCIQVDKSIYDSFRGTTFLWDTTQHHLSLKLATFCMEVLWHNYAISVHLAGLKQLPPGGVPLVDSSTTNWPCLQKRHFEFEMHWYWGKVDHCCQYRYCTLGNKILIKDIIHKYKNNYLYSETILHSVQMLYQQVCVASQSSPWYPITSVCEISLEGWQSIT